MKNKRITFLLGAGAAIPWGGPTTCELTDSVLKINKFKTSSGENVTKYLFKLLEKTYNSKEKVNFETIVALIESLLEFYDTESMNQVHPDFNPFWPSMYNIKDDIDKELFSHYELKPDNRFQFGYPEADPVSIVNNEEKVNSLPCDRSKWKVKVLTEIYKSILLTVIDRIWDYCLKAKEDLNDNTEHLVKLITGLIHNQNIVRFYTTNYDRLLPHVLKNEFKIFDGFTDENIIDKDYIFDYNKTLIDTDSLCYYNMHGSIYWEEGSTMDFLNKSFILLPSIGYPHYDYIPKCKIDNGKQVLFLNILMGYDKLQKIFIPPLNYFESAFSKDCISSDYIFVVGSSLGDFDIRKSIYTSLSEKKKKLVIIDKEDSGNIDRFTTIIRDLSPTFERSLLGRSSFKYWYKSDENNCFLYTNGFDGFLESEAWKDLDFVS